MTRATLLTNAWAEATIKADGLTTAAPYVEVYDALVEPVAAARPAWTDERVWAKAETLALAILT